MKLMSDDKEQQLLSTIKSRLDEAEENLPANVTGRLQAARFDALNRQPQSLLNRWAMPAAAISGIVLTAVLGLNLIQAPESGLTPESLAGINDFTLLLANDDFEMYQDLEFYLWLDESDEADIS